MDFKTFKLLVMGIIPIGTVLQNPGGGTSIIKSLSNEEISYKRADFTFKISFRELFEEYDHFKGTEVSTNDLKTHTPSTYDTKEGGHDCHCTFLFMILCRLPLVVGIEGRGKKGSPFFINIPK